MPIDPVTTIAYPGPPTLGTWQIGDAVIDSNDLPWECTAAGTPGTWVSTNSLKAWTALTLVSGTAAQANPAKSSSVFFSYTTTGSATAALAIGPTSGVADAVWTEAFGTGLTVGHEVTLPAGWYIKVTLVNATMVAGGYVS
jgi:hypothetical protein